MRIFGFDIETDTSVDGLDPRVAEIVSFAIWSPDVEEVVDGGTERERIERFLGILDAIPPAVACSWNGAAFDIPFVEDRARLLGIETGFLLVPDPSIVPKYNPLPGHAAACRARLRHHHHADVAYAYRAYALADPQLGRSGWSLKPVCGSLGIDMVEVDREHIHLLTAAELRAYNLSDARGTCLLAQRLSEGLASWIDRLA